MMLQASHWNFCLLTETFLHQYVFLKLLCLRQVIFMAILAWYPVSLEDKVLMVPPENGL